MSNVNTEWLRPKKTLFTLGRASLIEVAVFLGGMHPSFAKVVSKLLLLLYEFHPTERLIEYAFVHEKLAFGGRGRVLDVGCGSSGLPLELASKGYHVFALDPKPSSVLSFVRHPNLEFVRGDILEIPWENDYFDFVTMVSVLEHIGLSEARGKDVRALQEIQRILKDDGRLILTVPFGRKGLHAHQGWFSAAYGRVYDEDSLAKLLSPVFRIIDMQYAVFSRTGWEPASLEEVKDVDSARQSTWKSALAIAMVVASPKR